MRLDRSRRAEDDLWLGQKMLFFVLGAVAGIAGMVTGRDWLIYIAVAILAVGFILRVAGRRRRAAEDEAKYEDEADDVESPPADWAHFEDAPADRTADPPPDTREPSRGSIPDEPDPPRRDS